MIICVVSEVDQTLLFAWEDVRSTEPPEQKVVDPPAEIVGVAGNGFTVTVVGAEVEEHPFPSV